MLNVDSLVSIDSMASGEEVLPAFFIGFDAADRRTAEVPSGPLEEPPPWFIALEHTSEGYCMSYPSLFGTLLRLEDNLERGRNNPAEALRAAKGMQEDFRMLEREYPDLWRLLGTHGGDYPRQALDTLESFLRRHFDAPALVGGVEAFVQCDGTDPLAHFRGWRVLSFFLAEDTYDDGEPWFQWRIDSKASHPFDAPTLEAITRYGRQLGFSDPPRVYYLWGNCD